MHASGGSVLYCERLIRFIGNAMLDPHRHFEQQLLGELALTADEAARRELLVRLAGWIASGILDAGQRARLDRQLGDDQLPSSTLVITDLDAAWALITGNRDRAALEKLRGICAPGSKAQGPDQALARAGLADAGPGA